MKKGHVVLAIIFFTFSMVLLPAMATIRRGKRLQVGFYSTRCPQAEFVVAHHVAMAFARDHSIAAGFLRLFFHDCFVKGCDASILLDSTPSGEPVEKTSPANVKSLKGEDLIDEIKAHLEAQCPETVSCADILAFATREAVALSGLPRFRMPSGRRDSRSSRGMDVNLPGPQTPIDEIIRIFASKGITVEDMVVLMGAHSIGSAHCKWFDYRLKNNSTQSRNAASMNMDPSYAAHIKAMCTGNREEASVMFDPISPYRLENSYYKKLERQRGLLQSDQVLAFDTRTSPIVNEMANQPIKWSWKFVQAMTRLGKVNVLTGKEGEIRKNCRAFN